MGRWRGWALIAATACWRTVFLSLLSFVSSRGMKWDIVVKIAIEILLR